MTYNDNTYYKITTGLQLDYNWVLVTPFIIQI